MLVPSCSCCRAGLCQPAAPCTLLLYPPSSNHFHRPKPTQTCLFLQTLRTEVIPSGDTGVNLPVNLRRLILNAQVSYEADGLFWYICVPCYLSYDVKSGSGECQGGGLGVGGGWAICVSSAMRSVSHPVMK